MNRFFLSNPDGLWALAALAAVAALYLFYRRYRPLPVTGLFLWGTPRRDAMGGRKVEKPLWRRSLLLDLLAAAFLALALAGPSWRGTGGRVVVIMDDAFAMRARGAHASALGMAGRILDQAGRGAVVMAGPAPSVLAGMGTPAREAVAMLSRRVPSESSSDLQAAVLLAGDLYGAGLDIHVLTNQRATPAAGEGNRGTVHILPGRGDNLAFAGAWREWTDESAGGERVLLSVVNHGRAPTTAELSLRRNASGDLAAERLNIEPGQTVFASFSLSGASGDTLVAVLSAASDADVIADDSVAHLPPVPSRFATYGLDGVDADSGRFFSLALEAAGLRPLPPAGPGEAPAVPDLLITADPAASGRALTLETPPPDQPGVFNPPYMVDMADPLCRDADLAGVPWVTANRTAPASWGRVFILAGDMPLYWRSRRGRLHLNLYPARCAIVGEAAWPALMANLAERTRSLLPGLGRTAYRPGESLRYRRGGAGSAGELELYRDGVAVVGAAAGREMVLPRDAGLYRLRAGSADVGVVAVLPLYGGASDATSLAEAARTVETGGFVDGDGGRDVDLWWLALGAGLLCLGINWRLGGVER